VETEIILNKGNEIIKSRSEYIKKDIPKYFDRDYINKVIDTSNNYKEKMLIDFLWRSGVRITECVSLIKGDIDFNNYTMKLKWLKSRKYKYRIAPLHPELRNLLQLYTAAMKDSDRVFPISRVRGWQICKKNLKGSPHQLRHSFAVNWLRCDGDIVTLHRVLGHSKIQTTMEYLKIVPVDQGKELIKIKFR
jgi:integrase/recombinase XerD